MAVKLKFASPNHKEPDTFVALILLSAREDTRLGCVQKRARKAPRFVFGQSATLQSAGGRVTANVKVRDISTRGCELEHAAGLSFGKNCELYFDWQDIYFGLEAQAVWKKEAQGRTGLQFRKVDKETQRRLNGLCAALSTQARPVPGRNEAAAPSVPESAEPPLEAHPAFPLEAAPQPPPPPVSERSRRGVPRYASDLRGLLLNPSTGAAADVILVEISISGGRLEGTALPEAGQQCELRMKGNRGELVLHGEVVWKGQRDLGLKFSSPDEETVNQLREICRNLRLLPPPPPL
jgi:PilZ domain